MTEDIEIERAVQLIKPIKKVIYDIDSRLVGPRRIHIMKIDLFRSTITFSVKFC